MDMFPQTTKQRKRLWIYSLARKNSKDIQPIVSSHIESVVLLSRNLQKKIDENNYFYQKAYTKEYISYIIIQLDNQSGGLIMIEILKAILFGIVEGVTE